MSNFKNIALRFATAALALTGCGKTYNEQIESGEEIKVMLKSGITLENVRASEKGDTIELFGRKYSHCGEKNNKPEEYHETLVADSSGQKTIYRTQNGTISFDKPGNFSGYLLADTDETKGLIVLDTKELSKNESGLVFEAAVMYDHWKSAMPQPQ